MKGKIFVANIGSSSRKYALFDSGHCLGEARMEIRPEGIRMTTGQRSEGKAPLSEADYRNGAGVFLGLLLEWKCIENPQEIHAVCLRIVAPGSFFQANRRVDDAFLKALRGVQDMAPLHLEPTLAESERLRELFPTLPFLGISDSAFHAGLPPEAREYAISHADAARWDIHRFGYHGISVQSILRKLGTRPGGPPERIIVCHLGSGASVTAVRNGKSLDTSMGFSPLEGLVMGTRAGDMDVAAALYLGKRAGLDPQALQEYLNSRCGLMGLSGATSDLRALLEKEESGDGPARLAVEIFVYRIRKYIGAYATALEGLDALVFTAAIGERSPAIRQRICQGLEWMGLALDPDANGSGASDRFIHASGSRVQVSVMATEEMREMARQSAEDPGLKMHP